jgi:hypothetical protein
VRTALIIVAAAAGLAFSNAWAQPSAAQNTPRALGDVYACSAITDDVQRLACFDTAVGRLRQQESAGQVVAVDREHVATLERESFGFSLPSLDRLLPSLGGGSDDAEPEALERIQVEIARIVTDANGRASFVMTNGQVWRQVETQRTNNVRVGDNVTVRRAALGSFLLSPSRGGLAHRVRREN